jgi:hypothetical protein
MSIDANFRRDVLHYMMGVAFIEIRAASSVHAARKFADVFHDLPMDLLGCSTTDDYDAEFQKLLERAKHWGLENYVDDLKVLAEKVIARRGG